MGYKIKFNSDETIYFKTSIKLDENSTDAVKAIIRINSDSTCYYNSGHGEKRVAELSCYNSIKEQLNATEDCEELQVLMELIIKGTINTWKSEYLSSIPEQVLGIKCYKDKRFKDEPKQLYNYIVNKEEEQLDSMNTTVKTVQKTATEYETEFNAEHYTNIGKAIAHELSEQVSKAKMLQEQEDETPTKSEQAVEKEKYTADDFNKEISLPEGITLNTLETLLRIKHFLLFTAAPGTGKTTAAMALASYILGEKDSDRMTIMSFNQATEYCDIVSGLRQDKNGNWKKVDGVIKNVCKKAEKDADNKYIIILDEINRGDTLRSLGEYLTAMSKIGTKIISNDGGTVVIPKNVYIIATMNTLDQSVVNLDAALRDRFAVIEMKGIEYTAEIIRKGKDDTPELRRAIDDVIDYIKKVNIELVKDRTKREDNQIGMRQLYTEYNTIEELKAILDYCIEFQIGVMKQGLDNRSIDEITKFRAELDRQITIEEEIVSESDK